MSLNFVATFEYNIHTVILNVKVCECVHLLPFYAQTARPIMMEFDMEVAYNLVFFKQCS